MTYIAARALAAGAPPPARSPTGAPTDRARPWRRDRRPGPAHACPARHSFAARAAAPRRRSPDPGLRRDRDRRRQHVCQTSLRPQRRRSRLPHCPRLTVPATNSPERRDQQRQRRHNRKLHRAHGDAPFHQAKTKRRSVSSNMAPKLNCKTSGTPERGPPPPTRAEDAHAEVDWPTRHGQWRPLEQVRWQSCWRGTSLPTVVALEGSDFWLTVWRSAHFEDELGRRLAHRRGRGRDDGAARADPRAAAGR